MSDSEKLLSREEVNKAIAGSDTQGLHDYAKVWLLNALRHHAQTSTADTDASAMNARAAVVSALAEAYERVSNRGV